MAPRPREPQEGLLEPLLPLSAAHDSIEVSAEEYSSEQLCALQVSCPPNQRPVDHDEIHDQPPKRKSNRNIRLTLIYTCFAFAGRSIWNQSVLATYVYLLTNDNAEAVGFITGVMGICQLLASLPTGYVADIYRRDTMLKLAAAVGALAIIVTLTALYVMPGNLVVLVVALAVWGFLWGIANTALGALFADSIADGDRAYFFTQRSILINLGNTVGPIMALALFFCLGDNWTVKDCCIVMTMGQMLCLPAIFILTLFKDNEDGDDNNHQMETSGASTVDVDTSSGNADVQDDSSDDEEDTASFIQDIESSIPCNRSTSSALSDYVFYCIPRQRFVPIMIAMADLTAGLASGMSIRYFPIFFLDTLKLSPVQVQVLYIVAPLLQACLMKSGQFFSQRYGRCLITIIHKWSGITCMVLLVLFSHWKFPAWIICVVYVLRTAFMNSTSPLTRSILMDNVKTSERGRWSALESVNMFSWSGSAVFGGFLVSFDGLLFNFSVTATMQFLATIPVLALMCTLNVDDEKDSINRRENSRALLPDQRLMESEATAGESDSSSDEESLNRSAASS